MSGPVDFMRDWKNGRPIHHFSRREATELATQMQRQFFTAYTDPKHPDHQFVSREIRQLHAQATAGMTDGERPL